MEHTFYACNVNSQIDLAWSHVSQRSGDERFDDLMRSSD
jgi:hypothetical protein